MDSLYKEMLDRVELEIAELDLPNEPSRLYDPIRYIMSLGGKRVRPVLTLLGCELFNVSGEQAMQQALAVELFHNFTLIHDDVMDSAEVRRKLPTVHKKWSHNVALLSGDAMMVLAYQRLLFHSGNNAEELVSVFSKTALEVCEGQQLDMDYALRDELSMVEYIEMIRLKTAVLLSCSLQLGAIVAGAHDKQLAALKTFGESLGLAFQVKDDYLDAFGGDEFGKAIGGDIAEGKRTWLTVKCLELADVETRMRLLSAYKLEDAGVRFNEVMTIYGSLNVRQLANEEVRRYSQQAIDAVKSIEGNEKVKETLLWLVSMLIGRTN
ncbi:MAG: polyprenyl synthetase family protein [Flavobacteriales bacterium]